MNYALEAERFRGLSRTCAAGVNSLESYVSQLLESHAKLLESLDPVAKSAVPVRFMDDEQMQTLLDLE